MNDQTPRRIKGSLLERAAELYRYGEPPRPPESERSFDALPPLPEAPVPEPEVVAEPVVADAPVPRPVRHPTVVEAEPVPGRRRRVSIDPALLADNGMLVPGGPVSALAEEFRLIKRQLILTSRAIAAKDADKARMILVCSARPDDGKTFCAINLALSLAAERDVEILLVDADFAKPDILTRLGQSEGPGLLDALAGAVDTVEECVVETDIPGLSLLPAGTRTHSDTELLGSARASALLDGLARANPRRIVIFDSPPVLAASPAAVLAGHVGQVMLVVRADRTSESDLREAVAMLDGCDQVQLVLNAVSFAPGGRRFGSYYGQEEPR